MQATVKIVAFDPNKTFTFQSMSGPMDFQGTWTFESGDSGTKVSFVFEGYLKGFMRLFEPMLAKQFESQMDASSARLKGILESRG